MICRAAVCMTLGLLAQAAGAAKPAACNQPYAKDVAFPRFAGEEIAAVRLDSEVYQVTPLNYADLRLLGGDGAEIPYALEKDRETGFTTVREPVAGSVTAMQEQAGNRLEIIWTPNADQTMPSGFRFETPLRNFERRVSVYAETPASGSVALVQDRLLYDYTRFMDLRGLEVAFAPTNARRYRIEIEAITDEQSSPFTELTRSFKGEDQDGKTERLTLERRPLRIDRISAWRDKSVEQAKKDRVAAYSVAGFEVKHDEKDATTVVTIRSRREPLTAFALETESRNFSRAYELQMRSVQAGREEWPVIARGTLSRIQFRNFSTNNLQIGFPERRCADYRMAIHNGDNPPLKVTGLTAEGCAYRLVFLHDTSRSCRLYYGAENLKPPVYDTAAVLAALRQGNTAIEASLGPEVRDPCYRAGGWKTGRFLESKGFFFAVVALVVTAIAWGLFQSVKKMDRTPSG
jgi:hypothetical protein